MPDKIHIVIADDHKIIRDGITALLEDDENIKIVAEAKCGEEALEKCRSSPVDIVIMDINMPNMNGIEATGKIKREFDGIKVLALTMLDEEEHIRNMMRAGASGYILKSSGYDEIVEALQAVHEGGNYFSDGAKEAVMTNLASPEGERSPESEELTDREVEILRLICQELTNQEIADELYISVRTVDAHRRNLLQKTGARNTAGLVRYAVDHDLLP